MNAKLPCDKTAIVLAVNTDPVISTKTEYHLLEDFAKDCIDEQNFKVKPESYIYSELPEYNCEECTALPYVNPQQLDEIVGYAIKGIAKKYDTDQTPHKEIDSQKVSFLIGKAGVFASNTNKKYMSYILGTDDINLFVKLAKAGEAIVFHEDIDAAYQIINNGMPETIFRMLIGKKHPINNTDLFIHTDQDFKKLSPKSINKFLSEKKQQLIKSIDPDFFKQHSIEQPQDLNQWGELIPLVQANTSTATTYPIHAIPTLARGAIQAIAEHVQAPIAMTAQCVIGAMSHIAQAHVNAPDPFNTQGEPCGLFLLTEGQSGSRKTTSRNLADRAIIKHEKKQYEQYRSDLEQWKCLLAGCDKKDKSVFLAETPPPHDPITRYSDITLESLAGLYVDGAIKNASISSDEAAQFFGGHTMKSDTRNQALGGYAKLFDDGSVERTRSKSNLNGSGRAYDVRLTFNLQGQHEVLSDALKDPVLRGQGFLPRFIFTAPENLAGTRLQDESNQANNANLDHRLIAYWNRCEFLLDECPLPVAADQPTGERRVIPIAKEAESLELEFYNEIERLQAKGQRYEYLQAFASRASQLARRLATVFAYFEGLDVIDRKTLSGACDVIRHSLGEWSRYAEIETVKENEAEKLIKNILAKCTKDKTNRILKTLALNGAPSSLRKAKEFAPCLNELIEFNYVRLVTINRSTYIELNPLLLK
ncbi:DUF3987 domain-containing protein [Acinetobacter sp. CS-2]|uniref:DUF3987 domain-containing protein n=1 Tax=Acinetobacter sp. CS-2 TaxID=2798861 RepID=UPI001904DA0D|nr:DUF3987 domain-containing protein [Acinetobacter sp. CS-2]QQN39245.1 DUF3987 domain-containing protein [Acinetobacter sp. CS-2]